MTMNQSVLFPIPLGNMNQNVVPPNGIGYCDSFGGNTVQRLQLSRYATAFLSAASAGAADYIILAGSTPAAILFTAGPGESGTDSKDAIVGGATATLTQAETNTNKTGALARTGELFKVVAIAVRVGPVCQIIAGTGGAVAYQLNPQSESYQANLVRQVLAWVTMQLQYQDDECFAELGVVGDYPDMAGAANNSGIVTTGTPIEGALRPLPYPFYAGGRNTSDQIIVNVNVTRELRVANLTPAPNAPQTAMPAATAITLSIPVRVNLYGVNFCKQWVTTNVTAS